MRWCFLFVKEERCILFFFKKKRRRRMVFACLCFGEIPVRKRRRHIPLQKKKGREEGWSFFFLFCFQKEKEKECRAVAGREEKMGKRKRGQASSLVQAFDVLSAAACDKEVVLLVCTVVDIVSEKHLISFFHDGGKSIINQKSTFLYPRFPRSSSLLIFSWHSTRLKS